jgi:hypothetical protein
VFGLDAVDDDLISANGNKVAVTNVYSLGILKERHAFGLRNSTRIQQYCFTNGPTMVLIDVDGVWMTRISCGKLCLVGGSHLFLIGMALVILDIAKIAWSTIPTRWHGIKKESRGVSGLELHVAVNGSG